MSVFEDGMDSIMKGIEGNLSQALDSSTVILKNSIRNEAPELSGLLKSDIQHKVNILKKQGEVFDESEYSKRIQYGMKKTDSLGRHYHMAPNQFYHRGADKAEPQITQTIQSALRNPVRVDYKKVKV